MLWTAIFGSGVIYLLFDIDLPCTVNKQLRGLFIQIFITDDQCNAFLKDSLAYEWTASVKRDHGRVCFN